MGARLVVRNDAGIDAYDVRQKGGVADFRQAPLLFGRRQAGQIINPARLELLDLAARPLRKRRIRQERIPRPAPEADRKLVFTEGRLIKEHRALEPQTRVEIAVLD